MQQVLLPPSSLTTCVRVVFDDCTEKCDLLWKRPSEKNSGAFMIDCLNRVKDLNAEVIKEESGTENHEVQLTIRELRLTTKVPRTRTRPSKPPVFKSTPAFGVSYQSIIFVWQKGILPLALQYGYSIPDGLSMSSAIVQAQLLLFQSGFEVCSESCESEGVLQWLIELIPDGVSG